MVLCYNVFWSFVIIYAVCMFGQEVSNAFDDIRHEIEQIRWYYLPPHIQQMLPTIIIVSQKSVDLRIFGSISCDLVTFKKVSFKNSMPIFIISFKLSLNYFFLHHKTGRQ